MCYCVNSSTDQQRCFVPEDSREPLLHVDAAAAFRVRPDSRVLIRGVPLGKQQVTDDYTIQVPEQDHELLVSHIQPQRNLWWLQIILVLLTSKLWCTTTRLRGSRTCQVVKTNTSNRSITSRTHLSCDWKWQRQTKSHILIWCPLSPPPLPSVTVTLHSAPESRTWLQTVVCWFTFCRME